jgi:geranylgeranyl diphosphate synthase type I
MQELNNYFEQKLPVIETDMQHFIDDNISQTFSELKYMLQYHMGWVDDGSEIKAQGKRIRPILAMLSGEICGLNQSQMLPFCSAIELLHNFSLIHDDIEDSDEKRRGRETLWKIWGIPQAINTGDLLFSLSTKSMFRAKDMLTDRVILSAVDAFHQTCNQLTSGQFLDMKFETMDKVASDLYLEMIKGKTAALLGYCFEVGAILSEKSIDEVEKYYTFGQALGIAFQIQDDYLGIWGDISKTGKASRSDLLSRKKSYPILLGVEKEGDFSELWFSLEEISKADADRLALLLEKDEIDQLVIDEVKRYTNLAITLLQQITSEGHPIGKIVFQLVNQLMNRNY